MAKVASATVRPPTSKQVDHVLPARQQQPVKAAKGDAFTTGGAKGSAAPLRPGSSAVTFVSHFESGLHLPAEQRADRVAFMKHSQLNFFRANPGLFFMDVRQAYDASLLGRPAPKVTVDGDAHLGNFGVVRGPDGKAVFTMNDYDQAGTGSPEADLERMATSAVLTARANGWSLEQQRALAVAIGESYVKALGKGGDAYLDDDHSKGLVRDLVRKGDAQTRAGFLEEWAKNGQFVARDDLTDVAPAKRSAIVDAVKEYGKSLGNDVKIARPIEVLDVKRRLGAGGSTLGLDRFYVLVQGKDDRKPRILELKQFPPPATEGSSPDLSKADPKQVVANATSLTGFRPPPLGAAELDGHHLLVREVEPERQRLDLETVKPQQLEELARQSAKVLAHAHAHGHSAALKAWVSDDGEKLSGALADFALKYANQVHDDFAAFSAAH